MICPNCGAKHESNVRYCGSCGTSIGADVVMRSAEPVIAERHEVDADQARFSYAYDAAPCPPIEVGSHYVNDCQQAAVAVADEIERRQYASEAERLRNSLKKCRIIGLVLAAITINGMISLLSDAAIPYYTAMDPSIIVITSAIIMGINMFFMPYGFAPILHWIGSHGFFIVFNYAFIIIAAMVVIVIAVIAGPIYIIAAHVKIKKYDALAAR